MRVRNLLFLAVAAAAGFYVSRGERSESPPPAGPTPASPAVSQQSAPIAVAPAAEPAPARDDADIRARIRDGAPGTYLLELLQEREQLLVRWPDHRLDAVRVWIERHSTAPGFEPGYPLAAERAFDEWREAGFPVRFEFLPDSADAQIRITWVPQLPETEGRRIGVTYITRDQHGWIVKAEIVVSTHAPDGRVMTPELVSGIARHEIGHALGLGHSPAPTDVMYPESRTTVISRQDRATLHVLYTLPPGQVK